MTLADMILAHYIIDLIGIELSTAILDVADGDSQLSPELSARAQSAPQILEHELGEFAAATQEVKAVLSHGLQGLKA